MEDSRADAVPIRVSAGHAWSRDETMACFALYVMFTDQQCVGAERVAMVMTSHIKPWKASTLREDERSQRSAAQRLP